ncbi:alpha/beta hydrolase [Amycolatopsis rhabdoformis]|uniref:Alpha/beta hydrolase n=1 Tax=Amycolatopsis rhabdoformis TaxID=1448059 RepID=A0ABZ1IKF8_9PSEU|nr:alpha/beta hydrolase [Amycolatopsis rhabdoformis]WSE34732.1 alpha/beta hydrolase [Amycolatopsis rhabdoformis]
MSARAPGANRPRPVTVTVHELTTFDGARVEGVLRALPGATTAVVLTHPRRSTTHHPLVDVLLDSGVSVWTQGTRSGGNDVALVYEKALLDVAAGMSFVRDLGFSSVVTLGHSGGSALQAFYVEQAAMEPEFRLDVTPAGRPVALAGVRMPVPDGVIFVAPHPGEGHVLLHCIDPSVVDEDPASRNPALDLYRAANGFAAPPQPSTYSADFLAHYRAAQHDRVHRIDVRARELAATASRARAAFARSETRGELRLDSTPRLITTYRTDADPRGVDPSLDPSGRPYGSAWGPRPDLTNYGFAGFARVATPDAWLSVWSAFTTNADFRRCAAGVHVPTLFVEAGDDVVGFPAVSREMFDALRAADKTHLRVPSLDLGPSPAAGLEEHSIAGHLRRWLSSRYETV